MDSKKGQPSKITRGSEWAFFKDENGHIRYNKLCRMCSNNCKQSFRVDVILCKNYEHRR